MTREAELQYHLEMVILQSHMGVPFTGRQIEKMVAEATPEQREAAYRRALIHNPLVLDDERRPV